MELLKKTIRYIFRQLTPNFFKREIIEDAFSYVNTSYAQEGEDLVIDRLLGHQENGIYIDIGAHHPQRFSNTYKFYLRGWSGLNIDAMPNSMHLFNETRPRDINIEQAIDGVNRTLLFHVFEEMALNTFDQDLAKSYVEKGWPLKEQKYLQTKRLTEILDLHFYQRTIDFMTIDVENFELGILESNDWHKYRPRFILIEDLNFNLSEPQQSKTYNFLKERGYLLVAKSCNTLFYQSSS